MTTDTTPPNLSPDARALFARLEQRQPVGPDAFTRLAPADRRALYLAAITLWEQLLQADYAGYEALQQLQALGYLSDAGVAYLAHVEALLGRKVRAIENVRRTVQAAR
jgi:hypothetical protein